MSIPGAGNGRLLLDDLDGESQADEHVQSSDLPERHLARADDLRQRRVRPGLRLVVMIRPLIYELLVQDFNTHHSDAGSQRRFNRLPQSATGPTVGDL